MLAKHRSIYSYICLESQQNQIDVPSQRTFCFSFGCQPAKATEIHGNRCFPFSKPIAFSFVHAPSHEWSLAIKYVKPSQAMFVRPAQHVPTHSTANEKRSSMHLHSALGAEVLGQAAIHSPLEGGQMSPANMVTAGCNKCCWVGYSSHPQVYSNHPKHDTFERSTTSFNKEMQLIWGEMQLIWGEISGPYVSTKLRYISTADTSESIGSIG